MLSVEVKLNDAQLCILSIENGLQERCLAFRKPSVTVFP